MGRPGLTVPQKQELWQRWKAGESTDDIARALGRSRSQIERLRAEDRGYGPARRTRAPRVLSFAEREEVSRGLAEGVSLRTIAARTGRAPSTISREVARNGGRRRYRAARADIEAPERARRPKRCKLASSPRLCRLVATKLGKDWSPQQISGWLAVAHPGEQALQVSTETIYRSLFVQTRGVLSKELTAHLRSGRTMRRPHHVGPRDKSGIVDAVSISERPAEVEDRAVPGHWEGDLLIGTVDTQVATLVERQTRYVMLVKLDTKHAVIVADALAAQVRTLPEQLRQSLTWDRGSELARHERFSLATKVDVYFCDPHSPWQRGSNENTNGLLRQYLPRGTDFSVITQAELDIIAVKLNTRPRKTLGYETPAARLAAIVASTP
ncbi:MAG: IS30 family transposase [Chloroflexota bacterium]|nr:IS30 family transposase [Chloroflexota bacterium]